MRRNLAAKPVTMISAIFAVVGLAGCAGEVSSSAEEPLTLRLSHQWPAGTTSEGDFRAVLASRFAEEVAERSDGDLKVKVFPNSSLVEATEQFGALKSGAIDMSVYPLTYAGGEVPAFNITMMPTLVRDHAEAQKWKAAEIGQRVEQLAEDNGLKILTWVWNSGVFAVKGPAVVAPSDIRPGMVMRGAGSSTEEVLKAAGAGISSLPSSEIYTALQTGVLDGVTTSASSTVSFNLQEQIDSYTAPTDNSFWFIMQPLVISLDAWEKLNSEQQEILETVGEDLQEFAYSASIEEDEAASKTLADAGVTVVEMDDQAFTEWRKLSEKTAWKSFAQENPEGQELLDLAKQISSN
jgi:TRAP-type C4-dicarboxylate transport system substrate-binding protein